MAEQPAKIAAQLQQAADCLQRGDQAGARTAYEAVLKQRPEQPDALHWLGALYLQGGQMKQGLQLIQRSLAVRPDDSETLTNCGLALQSLGDVHQAIACFQRGLTLQPQSMPLRFHLGNALAQAGRIDAAETELRQALAIEPGSLPVSLALAQLLQHHSRFDEALELLRALSPPSAPLLVAQAKMLRRLGRVEEALDCYDQALDLDPAAADAQHGRGVALKDLGDRDRAAVALREATRLQPTLTTAWRTLAGIRRFSADDSDWLAIREVSQQTMTPLQRMHLDYALGKGFEDIGDHQQAFEHYRRANRARRAEFQFSIKSETATFRRLQRHFSPEFFARWQGVGVTSAKPIFVVGMPRSGTTLVEQILVSHSVVTGGGELHWLPRCLADRWQMIDGFDCSGALRRADEAEFGQVADAYLDQLADIDNQAKHVTDKLPNNFLHLGLIHVLFPNATIVHCRRDPRATCFSIYKHYFSATGHTYAYDMVELGQYYRLYEELMAHWREVLPTGRIYDIDYERLVADQDAESRSLIEACGLVWEPQVKDFHRTRRAVSTISASQVRRPIYDSSVAAWKPYEKLLQPLLAELDRPT